MADDTIIPFGRRAPATEEGLKAAEQLRTEMRAITGYADRALTQAALDIARQEQNPATAWRVLARRSLEKLAEVDGPEAAARYAGMVGDMLTSPPRPAA